MGEATAALADENAICGHDVSAQQRLDNSLDERGTGRPDHRQFVEPCFDGVGPEAVVHRGAPVEMAALRVQIGGRDHGLQCVCSSTVVTPASAAAAEPLVKSSRSG